MHAHPVDLVLPGEPAPVRLMNTTWVDRDGVFEALEDARDLRVFLAAIGRPVPADLRAGHLGALRELRAGLRALAAAGGSAAPAPAEQRAAVEAVNAAMAASPATDVLGAAPGGWTLTRLDGSSFPATLGRLAREGAAVLADRSRPLRTCDAPGCGLFFVKHHQRRRWCSTECGNRVRAARYYQRHRRSGAV